MAVIGELQEMTKTVIEEILNSNITYYIVVPFFILFLGWIHNWHDKKSQGVTIMKGKIRRKCPFFKVYTDFVRKINAYMVCVLIAYCFLLSLEVLHITVPMWIKILYFSMVCGFGVIDLIFEIKTVRCRIELLKHKVGKIIVLVLTEVIYFMPIFMLNHADDKATLVWGITLCALVLLVPVFSDHILIYSNKYVSVTLNDGTEIKDIQIDKIKVKRKWMVINKIGENEIRIRESSVIRINYYGEEYIKVYCPIVKWFKLDV